MTQPQSIMARKFQYSGGSKAWEQNPECFSKRILLLLWLADGPFHPRQGLATAFTFTTTAVPRENRRLSLQALGSLSGRGGRTDWSDRAWHGIWGAITQTRGPLAALRNGQLRAVGVHDKTPGWTECWGQGFQVEGEQGFAEGGEFWFEGLANEEIGRVLRLGSALRAGLARRAGSIEHDCLLNLKPRPTVRKSARVQLHTYNVIHPTLIFVLRLFFMLFYLYFHRWDDYRSSTRWKKAVYWIYHHQ